MKSVLISLTAAVLLSPSLACVHAHSVCPQPSLDGIESQGARDSAELVELIGRLLDAHCRCDFPESLGAQLTFGGAARYSRLSEVFPSRPECLGILDAEDISVDADGKLVCVVLRPRSFWARSESPRYLVVAVWQEDGWLYYWPSPAIDTIY